MTDKHISIEVIQGRGGDEGKEIRERHSEAFKATGSILFL